MSPVQIHDRETVQLPATPGTAHRGPRKTYSRQRQTMPAEMRNLRLLRHQQGRLGAACGGTCLPEALPLRLLQKGLFEEEANFTTCGQKAQKRGTVLLRQTNIIPKVNETARLDGPNESRGFVR